jgi:5-methylcytosine-specific restriction endonuclease McrA
VLLRDLVELIARDRLTTAEILAHIAEVDARRLYAPAGYSSMHAYCVGELRLSEDAAAKRIHAARAARRFPQLYAALAEGRIHLSGVCLLAPHLTEENAGEMIQAAHHKRKSDIEELLARLFGPPPKRPAVMRPLVAAQHAPGHAEGDLLMAMPRAEINEEPDRAPAEHAPGHVEASTGPERFLLQVTIDGTTRAKIRYLQTLLSHAVPSGDVAQVLDRALDALIVNLEKRKFGAVAGPRRARPNERRRHIPAGIRRMVWERDGGQCTFVGANGTRCHAQRFLEFDHIDPVARGGLSVIQNLRPRCRTHNQYEAERALGAEFMNHKRIERRVGSDARPATEMQDQARDVLAGLRNLGCRPRDARRAAEYAAGLPVTNIEERMRAALKFLGGRLVSNRPVPAG